MTAAAISNGFQNYLAPSGSGASSTSERLARLLIDVQRHARATAIGSVFEQVKNELFELTAERSMENWDDQGAEPISDVTLAEAVSFLESLPSWLPLPEPLPEPDGSIAFEWYYATDRQFAVSLNGTGRIAFAGKFGAGERVHGIEEFGGQISPIVRESIKRAADQRKTSHT